MVNIHIFHRLPKVIPLFPVLAIVITPLEVNKVYLNTSEMDVILEQYRISTPMIFLKMSSVFFSAFYLYCITFNTPPVLPYLRNAFVTVNLGH